MQSKGRTGRKVVLMYSKLFQPHEGWYLRVYNQCRGLVDDGYRVTLLAWYRSPGLPREEVLDGFRILRIGVPAPENRGPANAPRVLRFNAALLFFLLRNDFDLVQCFNVDTMLPGLLGARLRRKRAILDLCEPDYYRGFWNQRWEWLRKGVEALERFCAKRFDRVFVHNTYQIRKFQAAGIDHLTQVGSYPNRSLIDTQTTPREAGDTIIVGRLGTAYADNGFEEIVAAFRLLIQRAGQGGGGARYRLLLAGHVFDTYRETFDGLVESLGDHVEVMGAYDAKDLPELYRRIDIALILQGRQHFEHVTPTKLFESMARGVPVVANPIGDMGDIVEQGECGVVVDESNPQSICMAIERLGSDPELRLRMAANGRRLVRDKYSWEAVRGKFLETYRSLLGSYT